MDLGEVFALEEVDGHEEVLVGNAERLGRFNVLADVLLCKTMLYHRDRWRTKGIEGREVESGE